QLTRVNCPEHRPCHALRSALDLQSNSMAQSKDQQIGAKELIEYLDTKSDFAFELRCLERLNQMGFSYHHGGSYVDPVTKKPRQFDIRVRKQSAKLRIRCADECKNLSPISPLLVMCAPRSLHESFHDLILSRDQPEHAEFYHQS